MQSCWQVDIPLARPASDDCSRRLSFGRAILLARLRPWLIIFSSYYRCIGQYYSMYHRHVTPSRLFFNKRSLLLPFPNKKRVSKWRVYSGIRGSTITRQPRLLNRFLLLWTDRLREVFPIRYSINFLEFSFHCREDTHMMERTWRNIRKTAFILSLPLLLAVSKIWQNYFPRKLIAPSDHLVVHINDQQLIHQFGRDFGRDRATFVHLIRHFGWCAA